MMKILNYYWLINLIQLKLLIEFIKNLNTIKTLLSIICICASLT